MPPQYALIREQDFLETSENSIVTIPTSTGKTLLAELVAAYRMQEPGSLVIYIAPYIALGRQVHDCFRTHSPPEVDVKGYFGNFNTNADPINPYKSTVIIATPERLDGILRAQDLYDSITTVIVDEAHGLENGVRGARLEALIARLKLQQETHNFRIILLSAVLTEADNVRSWLGAEAIHYSDSWRPTARRLAVWSANGQLGWLYGNDPLRPSDRRSVDFIGRKALPWPQALYPTELPGQVTQQRPKVNLNVAHLAIHLHSTVGGPVLLACGTKGGTRGVAHAIAAQMPDQEPSLRVAEIIADIQKNHVHLEPLAKMLKVRVAYHNASLPSSVRIAIEDAVKHRELSYIAATTTLAEGVDLPFRTTIIVDWLLGYGARQAPMSALLFRNIAGRCGRAGEFVEGDTVIFENMLGNKLYTANEVRSVSIGRLFSDPLPLRSAIANDDAPDDVRQAIRSAIGSQLLASIPENPLAPAIDEALARALMPSGKLEAAMELLSELREELLNDDGVEPFARAASPMWLTDLGMAANKTGFGPRTCRQMLAYLAKASTKLPLDAIAVEIIMELGACDEQSSYVLTDIVTKKRTQFYVKADDLEYLAKGWLAGTPITDMFVNLPRAISSKAAVTPAQWVQGTDYEVVAAQYDKFVDLVEYTFGNFLPWICRALSVLQDASISTEAFLFDWQELGVLFETAREVDALLLDAEFEEGA